MKKEYYVYYSHYGTSVFLFEMCFWCLRPQVFLMSPRACSSFVEKKKVIRLPSVKTCLLGPWGEPACNWSVCCLTASPIGRRWPAVTSWLADGFNVRPRKHDPSLRLPDPVSRLTAPWESPVRGHGGESWLAPAVSQCRGLRLPLGAGAGPLGALTSPHKPPDRAQLSDPCGGSCLTQPTTHTFQMGTSVESNCKSERYEEKMAGCLVDRWLTTHTHAHTLKFRMAASSACWEKLTFSTSHTSMNMQRYTATIDTFSHIFQHAPDTHLHTLLTFGFLWVSAEGSQFYTSTAEAEMREREREKVKDPRDRCMKRHIKRERRTLKSRL